MRFDQAKKLHNEDEVTVKRTGQIVRVFNIKVKPKGADKALRNLVQIEADGYCGENALWHDEVS